jgi:hypothetical protein
VAPSGPFTGLLALLAATVGSGILLGGFVAGLIDLVRGSSRRDDATRFARIGGYIGGVIALLLLSMEPFVR